MEKRGRFHPLESLCTAFSLYSRIPVPKNKVTQEGFRYALCFFPLIGVITGLIMILFKEAADALYLGNIAFCCVGTAIPLIITGGIHMDGFLDTADALSSFGDMAKKREILKDPHTGAFALIWGGIYLLLYVAAFSELKALAFPAIGGIYVMSRALSGYAVVAFKKAEGPGMVKSLSEESEGTAVKICMAVWLIIALVFFFFTAGWIVMIAETVSALICLAACYAIAKKEFGGMSGDLNGFFLQACELVMLAVLALASSFPG